MPDRLLGILGNEGLELALGPLVVGRPFASMPKGVRCQRATSRAFGDKELFRKVSKPEWGRSPLPLADTWHAAVEIGRVKVHPLHAHDHTMQYAVAEFGQVCDLTRAMFEKRRTRG
jgi:hypothetical protein